MRRNSLRYIVTGPGLNENDPPSYADPGPALSRAITAAGRVSHEGLGVEATFYARDAITDRVLGYSETDADGNITTRRST